MTAYAGLYSGACCWLVTRTSTFCPDWVVSLDFVLPWVAAFIFAYALAAPAVTLYEHYNCLGTEKSAPVTGATVRASRYFSPIPKELSVPTELSKTELFRVRGLIFIGVIGCVFLPACLTFAFRGDDWWQRVCTLHPKQNLLESTDALFALFATEASMTSTRAANAGVAPYRKVVPAFALVCLILALVPCGCSLWWLGQGGDISFFSFYAE